MSPNVRVVLTLLVVVAIAGAIVFLESKKVNHTDIIPGSANIKVAISTTDVASTSYSTTTASRIAQKEKEYPTAKELVRPDAFINTDPFTIQSLIGKKVILVDFWTYSCINCIRTLPYIESWYQKYKDDGLLVIGVHTPEFDFEKMLANVKMAVTKFGITYPVVLDNGYNTWTAYGNQYWPHEYLIDIDGFIAEDHIGEGDYNQSEAEIVKLLNERKRVLGESGTVVVKTGEPAGYSVNPNMPLSPETYFGAARTEYMNNFDRSCLQTTCNYTYSTGTLKGYELSGSWKIVSQYAELEGMTGAIRLDFFANKVHFVAGAPNPVRAKILLDGKPVTPINAGADLKDGIVTITAQQLYTLIDLQGSYGEHTLEIQFLDAGVEAFTFTFG